MEAAPAEDTKHKHKVTVRTVASNDMCKLNLEVLAGRQLSISCRVVLFLDMMVSNDATTVIMLLFDATGIL